MEAGHGNAHQPHLDLMPVDAAGQATTATHVAIGSGAWSDPATWSGGAVPGDGALVHIPVDVTVSYTGDPGAHVFMIRLDGGLEITAANGQATALTVDTIVTSATSTLRIDARDGADGTVDVTFAAGQPAAHGDHYTDTSPGDGVLGRSGWDPDQLSLGLVASGKVDIKGQEVDAHAQLLTGPHAGATEIVFDAGAGLAGWEIGQKIVIGGTTFAARDSDLTMPTEDEVRTITAIRDEDGTIVVSFDVPLVHDHSGPADPQTGLELTGYVGNLTRNVTFSSDVARNGERGLSVGDDPGPGEHLVTERGHVMFMHNDEVTVHDVALVGLGRTDKSVAVDEVQTSGQHDWPIHAVRGDARAYDPDLDTVLETPADQIENMRGRYALHIHQANGGHSAHDDHGDAHGHGYDLDGGTLGPCPETGGPICHCGDQDADGIGDCHDEVFDGAWIEGVAVWGSPGWGITQHSSDAVLKDNVVYDVAGSAFVSEAGDETGRWEGNLAIGTYGARQLRNNTDSEQFNGDGGVSGNGFYTKSRALELTDNVAQSSARAGFMWHTEGGDVVNPEAAKLDGFGVTANHAERIAADRVPIAGFEGNVAIAAEQGIRILGDPTDSIRKYTDAYSHMKDFKAWEIDGEGVSVTYSSKYIFEDFLILGTAEKLTADAQQTNSGFYFRASAADMTVLHSHVEGFDHAVTNWTQVGDRQEHRRGYWDPKSPSGNPHVEAYGGQGLVEGINNPMYNLWNTNLVGLTYDDLIGGPVRVPAVTIELDDGTSIRQRGYVAYDTVDDVPNGPGVTVELIDDSRDGGLVALWREAIANNPDQRAMLAQHVPLAYQDDVYLGQIMGEDGQLLARWNYGDYVRGINADIWSGTVLEFVKSDSLGQQVFRYGDFSPLDPGAIERSVTTNERLVFSKEEVDATLRAEGYRTVDAASDVKFVVMEEQFTDRLTGQIDTVEFVVALDLAWELPEGTFDAGPLAFHDDLVIAPQYRIFENGELVDGRDPIWLGPSPAGDEGLAATHGGGVPPAMSHEEGGPGGFLPNRPSDPRSDVAMNAGETKPGAAPADRLHLVADGGQLSPDAGNAHIGGNPSVAGSPAASTWTWIEGGHDDDGSWDDYAVFSEGDHGRHGHAMLRLVGDLAAPGMHAGDQPAAPGGFGRPSEDRFMFDDDEETVFVDFEAGLDATEFMVTSFGFEELELLRPPGASEPEPPVSIASQNASMLGDFIFDETG